jgi:hypothetical protein
VPGDWRMGPVTKGTWDGGTRWDRALQALETRGPEWGRRRRHRAARWGRGGSVKGPGSLEVPGGRAEDWGTQTQTGAGWVPGQQGVVMGVRRKAPRVPKGEGTGAGIVVC